MYTNEAYRNVCKILDKMSDKEVHATLKAIEAGYPYEEDTMVNGMPVSDWHEFVKSESEFRTPPPNPELDREQLSAEINANTQ